MLLIKNRQRRVQALLARREQLRASTLALHYPPQIAHHPFPKFPIPHSPFPISNSEFSIIFGRDLTRMKYFFALSFFTLSTVLYAQEPSTLQMMNGKLMEVYQFNDSSFTNLQFQYDKNFFKRERLNNRLRRKEKDYFNQNLVSEKAAALPLVLREGAAEREEVFAVTHPNGNKKHFYYYDEMVGNDLSMEAMSDFISGESDARVVSTGKGWFYAGLGIGVVSGYAARQSIFVLAVPPLFALSANIPVIKIREEYVRDKSHLNNLDYAAGFESYTRSKNVREGLKGSAIGILVGLVTYAIVDNNR